MGTTLNSGATLNSHIFSTEIHWIVSSHVVRSFWFWSVTGGFCLPPLKFSKCSRDIQRFFCLNDNFQTWSFETKLWLKVNFSLHVQGYSETSVWFVHVTDCYCSAGKNLRKFELSFSTHKISLCSKSPFLMFIWQKCVCSQAVFFTFGIRNREAVGVYLGSKRSYLPLKNFIDLLIMIWLN